MRTTNPWKAVGGLLLVAGGAVAVSYRATAAEPAGEAREVGVRVERLSDLADGETRTYGEADRQVTATRRGDRVTVTVPGAEGEAARTVECSLPGDDCTVTTISGDGPRTMVMVQNSRDDGDQLVRHKFVIAHADGTGSMASATGSGPVEITTTGEDHLIIDALPGAAIAFSEAGLRGGAPFHRPVPGPDQALLRCPEGDTTMLVAKDEAASASYRCPKHGSELAPAKIERKVRIERRAPAGAPAEAAPK